MLYQMEAFENRNGQRKQKRPKGVMNVVHYEFIKPAMSVHIPYKQLRCHQPLVHMLARNPVHVASVLFHMQKSLN